MNVVPGFTLINIDEWANSAFVQHETLYSEEECLRMFAGDDPDALVYNHLTGVCSKVQGTFDIDVNDLRPDYYTFNLKLSLWLNTMEVWSAMSAWVCGSPWMHSLGL